jgi:hypothetical protein
MTPTCGRKNAQVVEDVNYLGEKVTIKYYEHEGRRVREYPDGSMLIELRVGHFRNFDREHWMCAIVRGELDTNSPLTRAIYNLKGELRRRVQGTHEPVTYYVDRDGKIGVPPEPGMEPPDDVTVHTFNTLHEADQLASRMQEQMYADFQDDGNTTAAFDDILQFKRAELVDAMSRQPGRKGREVVRLMLEDLDREERDRQRISTRAFFHYREYDR